MQNNIIKIIIGIIVIGGVIGVTSYFLIKQSKDQETTDTNLTLTEGLENIETDIHVVSGLVSGAEMGKRVLTRSICIGEGCDGSMSGIDDHTTVRIPLITQGGTIGCGSKIIFAPHTVAKTTATIDATYRTLFELQENSDIPEDNIRNVVAGYTQLFYDSVTLQNGVAKLYLTGTMYGPGHCAEPDMKAQIEQSALQFDTVNKLEVHINDEIFNWCSLDMSDGEGPCPEQPKLWIVEK